jgi:hypothetical protein
MNTSLQGKEVKQDEHFSVRSAYKLALNEKMGIKASNSSSTNGDRKHLAGECTTKGKGVFLETSD